MYFYETIFSRMMWTLENDSRIHKMQSFILDQKTKRIIRSLTVLMRTTLTMKMMMMMIVIIIDRQRTLRKVQKQPKILRN